MARTKEACMIILDVGKDTLIKSGKNEQTFFERAKNCVSKIVQRKIFSKPQDEVGLLLMGTEETNNQLNVEYGGYQHISETFELNPSNWQMLRIMEKQIHPSNVNADWFDALVVAMNFLKVGAQAKKFASLKIILVSALSVSTNLDEDQMEAVIQKLTDMPCELNVINDTVEHQTESDDQPDDDHSVFEPLGIFSQLHHKSKEQQANEKILSDVVFKSNGALCNIDSAELLLVHFEKKATRAAPWNSIMSIGTQIQINVSAYLLITEEKGLGSFKTVSTDPNAAVQLKTDYFKNDKQFEPDYENVISGYMYGSTVVPYDIDIDIDYKSGEQRLSCLGFTMAGNILEEYLCGTGTHVVVAKKDCQASEAKLSALVKAMIDLDVVMIATKVYRRDTRPKINVLMPTYRKRYPCLIMLELCFQAKKFASLKIILISALSVSTNLDEDQMIQKLTDMRCELNVINDTVEHQTESHDQPDDDHSVFEPLGIFSQPHHKSKEQQANEKILSDVVFKSNGALCNIDSAELLLVHFEKKATTPTSWNSIMSIGTQIQINVSGYLLITEEKGLGSFKTVSTDPNAEVKLQTNYFKNDKQLETDSKHLIDGYICGSSVVPYDPDIGIDYKSGEKRLSCWGFTMTGNILEEYLCGSETHVVVAEKGCQASEAKLSALVKAMIDLDVVMIATKVYKRDSRPKINVLMPTYRKRYPCLIMLELCFQEEVALLKFPPLLSSKHKPTDAQYEAMEKLIDSMDLLDALDDDAGSKEAFALHKTLNPIHQHMFRTVAHRALHPKAPIPAMDEELKKLVDVPPKVRERSKPVLEEVKNLFPLKEIKVNARIKWLQRANKITAHPDATGAGPSQQIDINDEDGLDDQRTIVEVGTVTPAEDFALLLKRGEKFATLCVQIQNVISDLVFKSMTVQYEKVAMAMMMYREEAKIMGPYRYNEWITEFKKSLLARSKQEFWEQVVVRERFGLIGSTESDMSTVTADEVEEFYNVNTAPKLSGTGDNADYVDADDLFANM